MPWNTHRAPINIASMEKTNGYCIGILSSYLAMPAVYQYGQIYTDMDRYGMLMYVMVYFVLFWDDLVRI